MWTFTIYAITTIVSGCIIFSLLRTDKPPGSAYLVLGITVAFLMTFVLIDSGRIKDIPGVRIGEDEFRLIENFESIQRNSDQQQSTRILNLESRIASLEKGNVRPSETATSSQLTRILWVDDHPANNATLVQLLVKHGAKVTEVFSTTAALTKLKGSDKFDVVISDMGRTAPLATHKSKRAGLELLEAIRRFDKSIPVFFYSSRTELADEALSRGANLFTTSSSELLTELGY